MLDAEKLSEVWDGDLLERSKDGNLVQRFVLEKIEAYRRLGKKRSVSLNVDAGWGRGKTWFLEKLKLHLEADGYACAHVNAWEDDFAPDPLVSILASIDATLEQYLSTADAKATLQALKYRSAQVAGIVVKGAVSQLARRAIGEGAEELAEMLGASRSDLGAMIKSLENDTDSATSKFVTNIIGRFKGERKLISSFKDSIKASLEQLRKAKIKLPLFVIIDELDRCRPTYAIELLERVKHIVETDDVVFIFGTNEAQLAHSVNAVYGTSFDSRQYLRRFFSRVYKLSDPDLDLFVKEVSADLNSYKKLSGLGGIAVEYILLSAFSYAGLSLRDIQQCTDIVADVCSLWPFPDKIQITPLVAQVILFVNNMPFGLSSTGTADRINDLHNRNGGRVLPIKLHPKEETFANLVGIYGRYLNLTLTQFESINSWPGQLEETVFKQLRNETLGSGIQTTSISMYADMIQSAKKCR